MTAGAANPYDKARAVENFLRTRFGYTLNLTGKPADDPLANFLFVSLACAAKWSLPKQSIRNVRRGLRTRNSLADHRPAYRSNSACNQSVCAGNSPPLAPYRTDSQLPRSFAWQVRERVHPARWVVANIPGGCHRNNRKMPHVG